MALTGGVQVPPPTRRQPRGRPTLTAGSSSGLGGWVTCTLTEMLADVLVNGADVLGRITVTRNA